MAEENQLSDKVIYMVTPNCHKVEAHVIKAETEEGWVIKQKGRSYETLLSKVPLFKEEGPGKQYSLDKTEVLVYAKNGLKEAIVQTTTYLEVVTGNLSDLKLALKNIEK